MEINIQISIITYLVSLAGCYFLVRKQLKNNEISASIGFVFLSIVPLINSLFLLVLLMYEVKELLSINSEEIAKKFFRVKE
ncbi:MAG: hypothetical protein ACRC7N_01285 [Clostridium sp.]